MRGSHREAEPQQGPVGRKSEGAVGGPMAYDAFISYSHENDAALVAKFGGNQGTGNCSHRIKAFIIMGKTHSLSGRPAARKRKRTARGRVFFSAPSQRSTH